MTVASERAFATWYTRCVYRGRGAIVELGTFLGAVTASLVRGLRARGGHTTVVDTYDRFIADEFMADYLDALAEQGVIDRAVPIGASFRPLFEAAMGELLNQCRVHDVDLEREPAELEQPIELLFVDALKTPATARNVAGVFYPCLIPGRSLLVHQDFAHAFTWWIHVHQYRMRECFTPVYLVPGSSSMVFRVRRAPTAAEAARHASSDFDEAEVERAFAYSLEHTPAEGRGAVAAAHATACAALGDPHRARFLVAEYRARFAGDPELERTARVLAARTE